MSKEGISDILKVELVNNIYECRFTIFIADCTALAYRF
jgi:hypothetical protein